MALSHLEQEVLELETSLLQTSTHVKHHLESSTQPLKHVLAPDRLWILELTATFISNNGLLCVEGPIKPTIGALALKKAGLHGSMYNETQIKSNTSCIFQGYSLDAGEDPTYVGMNLFFRSAPDLTQFAAAEDAALEAYRAQYSLPQDMDLDLMSKCTAHLNSEVGLSVKGQCGPVNELYFSYNHHDLEDYYTEMICDDAPFQHVVFTMAMLKTTKQYPQHVYDQIIPGSCKDRGFESEFSPSDPDHPGINCFSQLPVWYLGASWKAAQGDFWTLDSSPLLGAGPEFAEHCKQLGVDDYVMETMSIQGCTCLPGTDKMIENEEMGLCSTPEETSDIRTWWNGQE